jgi:hypothetical protein
MLPTFRAVSSISITCKHIIDKSYASWFKVNCKVNGLDKDRCKTEVGMPNFSPAFS